jgi:hypothetical protein
MLTLSTVVIILIFGGVLLGPYRIYASYNQTEADQLASIRVSSIGRLLSVLWRTDFDGQNLDFFLFRIRIWNKFLDNTDSGEIDTEKTGLPDAPSDDAPFLFPFKTLFRMRNNIWDILRCARIDNVKIRGFFGTGDPATTGILYGFAQPLQSLFGIRLLDWTPDFLERKKNGQIDLVLHFVMASVLFQSAALAVRSIQIFKHDNASS